MRLEPLEDRLCPSFLPAVFPTLVAVQNGLFAQAQAARNDLVNVQMPQFLQFGPEGIDSPTFTNDLPIAETAYVTAVADYQRMLVDSRALNVIASTSLATIIPAAQAEAQAGDTLDLALLTFGPLIGLNIIAGIRNPATQALDLINDSTVQSDVSLVPAQVSPLFTSTTIAQATG
jgi:hypothetical protein